MATRKHFTKEFKLEAVSLIEHSGKSGTELARQFGVLRNQLYRWQLELRGKAERAFPDRGQHPESADDRSRSPGIAGRDASESTVTMVRNTHPAPRATTSRHRRR